MYEIPINNKPKQQMIIRIYSTHIQFICFDGMQKFPIHLSWVSKSKRRFYLRPLKWIQH